MNEIVAKIYPEDALLNAPDADAIRPSIVHTLDEMFRERVRRSAKKTAYGQYDEQQQCWNTLSWEEIALQVGRWQKALGDLGLIKGDRVGICYKNSVEWVVFDQAALSLGLVVVPLYTSDRADNLAYVLQHSGAKLAVFSDVQLWSDIYKSEEDLSALEHVLFIGKVSKDAIEQAQATEKEDRKLIYVQEWLPENCEITQRGVSEPDDLASIIYTSGTTGRPKGVMLSHNNILSNTYSGMRSILVTPDEYSLSFLPLSHTLERTVGYYGSMMSGAAVYFSRSIENLAEDLMAVKPTMIISVPRIFERVYNQVHQTLEKESFLKKYLFNTAVKIGIHKFQMEQGKKSWHPKLLLHGFLDKIVGQKVRDKLGGNIKRALVGGAPMSDEVTHFFIGLGISILQGYGLTETSPIVSTNTEKNNLPGSIGYPVRGVEVKLIENDELCVRGPNVMQGYWKNAQATQETMSGEWFKTGDRAALDENGFLHIIGRIKEIIVMANGEKVPPADIEAAIAQDNLFEQVMLLGEGKSFLSVLLVLNQKAWQEFKQQHALSDAELSSDKVCEMLLTKVSAQMSEFPGYAKVRRLHASLDEWSIDNGLLTPTLKLKRAKIIAANQQYVDEIYSGHGVHKN